MLVTARLQNQCEAACMVGNQRNRTRLQIDNWFQEDLTGGKLRRNPITA
jgi:hypothetical protein